LLSHFNLKNQVCELSKAMFLVIKLSTCESHWPEVPIVIVHRSDDACLGWWVKCGHFDITYPDYHEYFKDLKQWLASFNSRIRHCQSLVKHTLPKETPQTTLNCATGLGIDAPPPDKYTQNYQKRHKGNSNMITEEFKSSWDFTKSTAHIILTASK
jgi:hypothetical protein